MMPQMPETREERMISGVSRRSALGTIKTLPEPVDMSKLYTDAFLPKA
jgi:hypothetical protein